MAGDNSNNLTVPPEWSRKPLANGVHRFAFDMRGMVNGLFQWVDEVGDGAATFVVYGSAWPKNSARLADLDPINPFWIDQTSKGAVFPTSPTSSVGSDELDFADNGLATVMVQITVTTPFTRFSFALRGQASAS